MENEVRRIFELCESTLKDSAERVEKLRRESEDYQKELEWSHREF